MLILNIFDEAGTRYHTILWFKIEAPAVDSVDETFLLKYFMWFQ